MDVYITVAKILSLTFVDHVFACECLQYSIAYSVSIMISLLLRCVCVLMLLLYCDNR